MSLKDCYKHRHCFETILSVIDSDIEGNGHIVEWCKTCGTYRINEKINGEVYLAKFKPNTLPDEVDKLFKNFRNKVCQPCEICNGRGYRTQREIHQEKVGGDFPLEDTYFLWNDINPEKEIPCICKGEK